MQILITGGAGFIGPQVVKSVLKKHPDCGVFVLDKLTYAGRPENLYMVLKEAEHEGAKDINSRYKFIKGDICDASLKEHIKANKISIIINLAAESHVDRSIGAAPEFLRTEVQGTLNLLETVRTINDENKSNPQIKKVLFVGTDEVYGSIDRISGFTEDKWYELTKDEQKLREHIKKCLFKEEDRLDPGSPYAGSKAGADMMVLSYINMCGENIMPARITRCVNNFGPFQHCEKLLPLTICTLLKPHKEPDSYHPGYDRRIPIYDKGLAIREWIHTEDHAKAILYMLEFGKIGQIYNVGSGKRCLNRDILIAVFKAVKKLTGTKFSELKDACFDATGVRPGHDLCYGADSSKLRKLGWIPGRDDMDLEIFKLVEWYSKNQGYWEPIWDSLGFNEYWEEKYARKMKESGDEPFVFYDDAQYNRSLKDALRLAFPI
ncbi:NAD-dependent epimerase/dehydratase family protein [Candidatus Poribacteria bacterium]|nr:NAD-dependent epimerase/dehydratase family protein [Candidatus Poribacteria bacterium]